MFTFIWLKTCREILCQSHKEGERKTSITFLLDFLNLTLYSYNYFSFQVVELCVEYGVRIRQPRVRYDHVSTKCERTNTVLVVTVLWLTFKLFNLTGESFLAAP